MKLSPLLLTITALLCLSVNMKGQVYPQQNGTRYSLSFANIYFEVDANRGTKVSSLKIDDQEYLFNDSTISFYGQYIYWGSTVWLAPEIENKWPPFANIDHGTYVATISDTVMSFESKNERDKERDFYSLKKSFWIDTRDTSIVLEYTVTNNNADPHSKAIWEPTRVLPNGLTFWKKENTPWGSSNTAIGDISNEPVLNGDYYWLDFDDTSIETEAKFYANTGEGWYAHVNDSNQMFIKVYEDVKTNEVTPNEDEMQYWVALDHAFIELENESRYVEIPSHGSMTYRLKWYLRNVPESIDVSEGSNELIAFTKNITDKATNDPLLISSTGKEIAEKELIAYPNPATDHLYFDITTQASVTIYSISGGLKLSGLAEQGSPIDISNLNSGVYFYRILSDDMVHSGKFVKE